MSSLFTDLVLELTRDSVALFLEPSEGRFLGGFPRLSISPIPVACGLWLYSIVSGSIAEFVLARVSSISGSIGSSGGIKRSNWGRTSRNKHTLMAPERLNIETPKNVAAEVTDLCRNCDQRATESGRTTREYARG
jgi:hypothetical protein